MKKIFYLLLLSGFTFSASVSCNFASETVIRADGTWLKSEEDFMKLYNMFGDGLSLKMDNSLLANLDSGQPFLAGKVSRGSVFLQGSDFGVEGKLTSVKGDLITIYDGFCSVGFG